METLKLLCLETYNIPNEVVAKLGIMSVEEIKDVDPRVLEKGKIPKKYHKRIVKLVNDHRSIYDTIWTLYGDY
jgi:hypothetical protein